MGELSISCPNSPIELFVPIFSNDLFALNGGTENTNLDLDLFNYLDLVPTGGCNVAGNLSIPVEVILNTMERVNRGRSRNKTEPVEDEMVDEMLEVKPNLCEPLGLSTPVGAPLHLVADLNVPSEKVALESVSWSKNGVQLPLDDPNHQVLIRPSDENKEHTSVILNKPAVTLEDAGFYSVTYRPLPTINEEPLAEEQDEEGYGEGWEVDFPELLVLPSKLPPPVVSKGLPQEIRVAEGDTVTLDVEIAEGAADVTPRWSINGRDIDVSRY